MVCISNTKRGEKLMQSDQGSAEALKILLLTTKPPYPATDGGRIAVYEPLRRLAARGHHVTLLTFRAPPGQDEASFAHLASLCRVEAIVHDTRTRPMGMGRNLFSRVPYTISKYRSPLMASQVRALLAATKFDVVHVEQVHMAGYGAIAQEEFGIPVVLRQQNIESHLVERYWKTQTGLRRIYAKLQAVRLRNYEAEACAAVDRCLAITFADATRLHHISPSAKTLVVPAGVDVEEFAPLPHLEEREAVVFVGAMDWLPNVDAVLWFCKDILPAIRQEFPEMQFHIVGKNPPAEIRRLAETQGIHVAGFVEDVRDYFAKATVFVIPLRVGGGMRVKLLQAMAMARPVVSTPIGAEGIQVEDGRNILVAESAEDFAASVLRLLSDRKLGERLGQNARQLVEETYSWETATDLLEQVYREVSATRCLDPLS